MNYLQTFLASEVNSLVNYFSSAYDPFLLLSFSYRVHSLEDPWLIRSPVGLELQLLDGN